MPPRNKPGNKVLEDVADRYLAELAAAQEAQDRAAMEHWVPPPDTSLTADQMLLGLGSGFVPGAGIADVMGQLPGVDGQMMPSTWENLRSGRYIDAGAQMLAGLGDVATYAGAVPLGVALKAPRAARRTKESVRLADWMTGEGNPRYFLHITDKPNLPQILEKGLIPGKSDEYVYLWSGGLDADAERIMREARQSRLGVGWDEAGAVQDAYIAVDRDALQGRIEVDPYTGEARVKGTIPPEALRLVDAVNVPQSGPLASRVTEFPFPQYSEQYPPVPPPVEKVDPKKGTTFMGRGTSPETEAFLTERARIQKDIEKGGYQPYFDPEQRMDPDAAKYPVSVDTRKEGWPKKPATVEKWRAKIQTDDARKRLQDAYDAGINAGYHDRWYEVGQLEQAFVDELGPDLGPKMFRERFAEAMAATTGGADPQTNLVSAMYGNYLKTRGLPIPESAAVMPVPTKGLYLGGNMEMYDKVINRGQSLGLAHPKRHNFAANFMGHKEFATVDEQMTDLITPGLKAPPGDTYGLYEELIAEMAAKNGVSPREFQDVAWGGKKATKTGGKYEGKPMIAHVNEAIERTHRLTGMSREEILRRGIIRGQIPVYGLAAGVGVQALMGNEEPTY